jgi:SAM-dependent methyltransferase
MTAIETSVARHYGREGLEAAILAGLSKLGKRPGAVAPDDLKPVDEFHIGGVQATDEIVERAGIAPGARVLDIGCGIGGAARRVAALRGASVVGVDLTPEFVDTARRLSALVGLDAEFRVGSAVDLPVEDRGFDAALMLHVGMNVPDKARIFAEAARALRPGGTFVVYDVMTFSDAPPVYPTPWATTSAESFLAPPETYLDAAAAAGFDLVARRDRGDFARAFFAALAEALDGAAPPPLGLGILMGPAAAEKVRNMVDAVGDGRVAPVELILRLPASGARR